MNRISKALTITIAASSVFALSACAPSGSNGEERTVKYATGSAEFFVPEGLKPQESLSTYTEGEASLWVAAKSSEGVAGGEGNPIVSLMYEELTPEDGVAASGNFDKLASAIVGTEYQDFTVEEVKVDGAREAVRFYGVDKNDIKMDIVVALAEDDEALTMLITGYTGDDLKASEIKKTVESLKLSTKDNQAK